MNSEIEISSLDLRYQGCRIKNPALEAKLIASIAQGGIREPLQGVPAGEQFVLLNGFKRYRCACRLQMGTVPVRALGDEQTAAILALLRGGRDKSLSILEEAGFLAGLKRDQGMSLGEIARSLGRSKGWVSMRLSLFEEMSPAVAAKLFEGAFPVYAYMYAVRPFMRMNGVEPARIDQFVQALSGQGLSLREIEHLAHGFFRGPELLREQIASGNLSLPLQKLKQAAAADPHGCSEFERSFLRDLERVRDCAQRIMARSQDPRLQSRGFHAQCHLLTGGLLTGAGAFNEILNQLHDQSGQA